MMNPLRGARQASVAAAPGGRHGAPRRVTAPLLALSVVAALLLLPALASADSSSTLTVVGTSDVSDSGLMGNVIMPGFEAAYPQFTFKYVGSATQTAITNAETGVGGPSVLIVHAPSLENQFVAGGFSYEPYGRAIFTNDFILAGPTTSPDPAGIAANAPHDIVQAFMDLAVAGNAGTAEFVSRQGAPGTTVAEHGIWALVGAQPNPPSSLLLCTVSAANGGGETPIKAGGSVTASGQPCPSTVTPPSWYFVENLTQGPNVVFANACNGAPGLSPGTCYVFTDRGTFDYLSSGTDLNGGSTPVTIPNLRILTRNNSATAPGGANALTNYFHAYVINPAAFTSQPNISINVPAAEDFVNYLTSPALQSQLKNYLDASDTPPFVADASPILTAAGIPSVDPAGTPITVSGNLTNAEPGFPVLSSQPVTVSEIEGGVPVAVASANTDANGNYSATFVPTSSGSYQVSTGLISQIEEPTLTPPFGDLLQPAATAATAISVQGAVTITAVSATIGGVVVAGNVGPAGPHAKGTVAILARPQGSTAAFTQVASAALATTQPSYAILAPLGVGKWTIEAFFQDPGQVLAGTSGAVNVTVLAAATPPATASTAKIKKLTIKAGALTVTGTVSPAPTASGAYVELLGRHTTKLSGGKTKIGKLSRLVKLTIKKGTTAFTIHAKLTRGYHWQLETEYVRPGHKAGVSKLNAINVH
jgi:ABC-type tungstate transport system permease subunit